jgi:hypothetical protein
MWMRIPKKLIGSLIALGFEQAAMSREDIPDENRREFHVIEDEFFNFAATSQTTFQRGTCDVPEIQCLF